MLKASKLLTRLPINRNFLAYRISSELIKKDNKDKMVKTGIKGLQRYPKTFEEKMMVVNDPKAIQLIQLMEFGVKYKEGKVWFIFVLMALGFLGYLFQSSLPIRINDRYFMVSPESTAYISGFIFAGFNFEKPFYIYLPLMFGIHRFSKFVSLPWIWGLIGLNCIIGDALGYAIVKERVSHYEVWECQRLCFGQGQIFSLIYCFWTMLGLKGGFTHLKSRIFLETVAGQGITRAGLPLGYLAVGYTLLQIIFYMNEAKNSEVVCANALLGVACGLLMRRFKPII